MIQYLKEGRSAADAKADQSKVRQTVEQILAEIESRVDAAFQELAQKFDKWERPNFRLRPNEIDSAVREVPESTLDDIRFAQTQIRNFAQRQRSALQDVEVETLPGIVLGHKNIPVNSVGSVSYTHLTLPTIYSV